MNNKERSPFVPGSPVSPELFVGRAEQIDELVKYARQATHGRQENVFLVGDRGIGKTSLASFVRFLFETQQDMVGIHVFSHGASTLEEMVRHVFDQLLKETRTETWFSEIRSMFGRHVKEVGMFGVSVSFNPPQEDLKLLVSRFPEAINNLWQKIKDKKKGIFIAIDALNALVERREFANWYKSFADEVATRLRDLPLFMMLVGHPGQRGKLAELEPSLMRIFRVVSIERLSDSEVKRFLVEAFKEAGMEVARDALRFMVRFSSGLPILMHEIGDAAFWIDSDMRIDMKDASRGVLIAAEKVGQKYLDPKVYRAIRSESYRSILRKLGDRPVGRSFKKKDIEEQLTEKQQKVFNNFLQRLKKLGVIESDLEAGLGAYRFVNEIYPVYIWLESEKARKK